MKWKTTHLVRKPKEYFKVKPNLEDYEKTYRRFSWKDAHKELDWLDEGNEKSGKKRNAGKKSRKLNAAYEAVDRHALGWRKNKVALYWEGADGVHEAYTFLELSELSSKFADMLRRLGVKKGDRVFFFMPRIPELYIGFLGTLKAGAIAGTMFAAFGPEGIRDRLKDSGARVLMTTPDLVKRVYKIKRDLPKLENVIIVNRAKRQPKLKPGEVDYGSAMENADSNFKIVRTEPEDYAFMLYTSGTTGKPKGVVHAHYAIVQEHVTSKWVLDLHDEDTYWCTADPGWVTGIAYGILGIWSAGASSVVCEGGFDPEKWYSILEKYKVSVWYTAPTAIRMLMAADGKMPKKYDFSNLRHLCSVGEPLNPECVYWSLKVFGRPFHDNWWQTETGGILIANYPCMPIKPGSMGRPLPSIEAAIIDDDCKRLPAGEEGNLAIAARQMAGRKKTPAWPSMMRKIWKNAEKYKSYFKKGWYITGDRAFVDRDGYFWFVGRADDVIKTSGERVGPFEVESALIEHPAIVEAGVIGKPDPLRGEIIKAFVVLAKGYRPSDELKEKVKQFVKKHLAGHAYPREIEFVKSLPKTRSGKIARRVLRARELGLPIGDVSTIEK